MTQNITDAPILPEFKNAFNYADKTNTLRLEDWLSILTLCFAPLIAHVISGVPIVVRRCPDSVSWLDYLCLYNPTTIVWRYLAIADRRIRFRRSWTAADMAASNALFWTSRGFDGSEEMMWQSRAFCTRTPNRNHTELVSTDALKTLITTLQGVQALVVLVRGILAQAGIGNQFFSSTVAMDTIFYPLSVFGLLRLFAAPWLTEQYSYAEHENFMGRIGSSQPNSHTSLSYTPPQTAEEGDANSKHFPATGNMSSMTLLEPDAHDSIDTSHPTGNSCPAMILRTCYVLLMFGILAICLCYIVPVSNKIAFFTQARTSVLWLAAVLYIFFSTLTILLLIIYLIRTRRTTTTVIPCIHTWWYRVYTLVLVAAMITLVVLSGVYTRRTACGKLTVIPPMFDRMVCSGTPVSASQSLGPIGFVSREELVPPRLWFAELNDGWCSGTLGEKMQPLFSKSDLESILS